MFSFVMGVGLILIAVYLRDARGRKEGWEKKVPTGYRSKKKMQRRNSSEGWELRSRRGSESHQFKRDQVDRKDQSSALSDQNMTKKGGKVRRRVLKEEHVRRVAAFGTN